MPRLYREAPLNGIWEGSGNMMALDVLRAMTRSPEGITAYVTELETARGMDRNLDRAIGGLKGKLKSLGEHEGRMRMITERMALALQGALLVRHGAPEIAEAFCATRLGGYYGTFGALPNGADLNRIIDRALPRQ